MHFDAKFGIYGVFSYRGYGWASFTVITFVWVNSRMPSNPLKRPKPDCFQPP